MRSTLAQQRRNAGRRRWATPLGLFLFVLGLYGLTCHGYVDIEDTEICYQGVGGLLDHGSLAIPDTENGRAIIRAEFLAVEHEDGRWYPVYPLLQFLLHVPGAVVGRALAPLATADPEVVVRFCFTVPNVLFGALLAVVIFALGRRLGQSRRIAMAAATVGCVGTMLWPHCQGTFVDPPLALFVATSVLCLLHARPAPGAAGKVLPWLVLAGLAHGCGASLRPSALLLLAPSAWYVRRAGLGALLAFLVPVALVIGGLCLLDVAVLGRPLEAGYLGWGRDHPPVWNASYTNGLYGLLISDGCGLFTLSPVLLLAVMAWPRVRRDMPAAATLILGHFAALVLFFAAFDAWYGGWCWGPRYLLPAVPLLAALGGCWLARPGRWRLALAIALAGVSVGIQALAVAVPHRIHLVVRSTSPAHPYMFFYYARFSPVMTHARILAHKLRGEPEVYTLRGVFGEPDDEPVAVTRLSRPQIDRFNAGFQHFALVRAFGGGRWLTGSALLALGLASLGGGLWLALRGSRPRADSARAPGDDGDVGADRAVADPGAPEQPRDPGQDP